MQVRQAIRAKAVNIIGSAKTPVIPLNYSFVAMWLSPQLSLTTFTTK